MPSKNRCDFPRTLVLWMLPVFLAASLQGASIPVPNASFESQVAPPTYPYVTTFIDSWQKAPRPVWFDEGAYGFTWDQTAGLFQNPPAGAPNHIGNMVGNQGLYFLAFPEVSLFQDYNTVDWNDGGVPTHAFNETYQVGQSYQLTLGVLGGLGGMPEGAILRMSLYYRDNANNMVTIAATPITYTAAAFPSATNLVDYSVFLPEVQPGDAWAGKNIGIQLLSAYGTGSGYWDMDNLRLVQVPEPGSAALLAVGVALWMRRRSRAAL